MFLFLSKTRYSAGKNLLNDMECQRKAICEIYQDESNEFGETENSENELLLTSDQIKEMEEMDITYQRECEKDFSPLRPTVEANENIKSDDMEEKKLISYEDLERGLLERQTTQEIKETNIETMQMTEKHSIHTSDTLPLNAI